MATTNIVSKEESREFMAVFPDIVRDLTDAGRHTDIPEITKWYAKVLQYNVPCGKKNRGLATIMSYKLLETPERLTPENIRLANILGWCVEMVSRSVIVISNKLDIVAGTHQVSLLVNEEYYLLSTYNNCFPTINC